MFTCSRIPEIASQTGQLGGNGFLVISSSD